MTGFFYFPDHTIDTATDYMWQFDAIFRYGQRFMTAFHCQETDPPSLSIKVLAGYIWNGTEAVEIPELVSPPITPPLVFRRVDRVVVNPTNGSIIHIQGDTRGNPPPIPSGWNPLCRFEILPDSFEINNSMITDERVVTTPDIPGVRVVYTTTNLSSADLGKTIIIGDGPAEIVLPPLQLLNPQSQVPFGQHVSIVSLSSTRQVVFAYPNPYDRGDGTIVQDLLDGRPFGYRIPSFANIRVHRLVTDSWVMTQKPAYSIGQIIEHAVPLEKANTALGLGWLPTDGRQLDRVIFGNLGDVYKEVDSDNYAWGNGDGSTTFNIPYIIGRVSIRDGQGSGLTNRTFATGSGQDEVALSVANLPNFNYPVSDPGHNHVFSPSGVYLRQSASGTLMRTASSNITHSNIIKSIGGKTNISISSGGLGQAHTNMQPYNVKLRFVRY